jgi:predicted CoA-binding protein
VGLDDEGVQRLLKMVTTVAIVPASTNPAFSSHRVASYLVDAGYTVWPVSAPDGQVAGQACVARLDDLEAAPDVVYGFVTPPEAPQLARQAADRGALALWLHEGIRSDEAEQIAEQQGLQVVVDRNMEVEHRVLLRGEARVYFMPM